MLRHLDMCACIPSYFQHYQTYQDLHPTRFFVLQIGFFGGYIDSSKNIGGLGRCALGGDHGGGKT